MRETKLNTEENKIKQLQQYLRTIATRDKRIPTVTVDGIYSPKVTDAVSKFQTHYSLPITGETDEPTWNKIYEQYLIVKDVFVEPVRIIGFKNHSVVVSGMDTVSVYFVQTMLKSLSRVYSNIQDVDVNGIYDNATLNSLSVIREASGIKSENLDKSLYNAITRLHNAVYS